ncbi:MAG: glycosyltransferase family 2 protein [Weeksellaceae bacterium]
MPRSLSVILPIFNEAASTVHSTLKILSKLKGITQIISVDDGSLNSYRKSIEKLYPNVIHIELKSNQGKTNAINEGLKYVTSDYILLLDSDLVGLDFHELQFGIEIILQNTYLDGLIYKRINANFPTKIQRTHLLLSGERIIKTQDLKKILQTMHPTGFQIELAINIYWLEHKKNIVWSASSALSPHKIVKLGLLKGSIEDFKMDYSVILGYGGLWRYMQPLLFFHPHEYKNLTSPTAKD